MKLRTEAERQLKTWASIYANSHGMDIWKVREASSQEVAWFSKNKFLQEQDLHVRVTKYRLFLENPGHNSATRSDVQIRKDVLLWVLSD